MTKKRRTSFEAGQLDGAVTIWQTVISHIKSGVPIEGLLVMAQSNVNGLRALIESK